MAERSGQGQRRFIDVTYATGRFKVCAERVRLTAKSLPTRPCRLSINFDIFSQGGTGSNSQEYIVTDMNALFPIIIIIAIVLAIVGGLVEAVNFLLWVGIILLILAAIGWLLRSLSGRRG